MIVLGTDLLQILRRINFSRLLLNELFDGFDVFGRQLANDFLDSFRRVPILMLSMIICFIVDGLFFLFLIGLLQLLKFVRVLLFLEEKLVISSFLLIRIESHIDV